MRLVSGLVLFFFFNLCTSSVLAQERLEEAVRLNTRTIDGRTDPGSIPRVVRIRAFAQGAEGFSGLNTDDARVLATWLTEYERLEAERVALSRQIYLDTCNRVLNGTLTASGAFANTQAFDDEYDESVLADFDEAYQRLSDPARAMVDEHMDSVTPGIRYSDVDYTGIAAVDDAAATAVVARTCQIKLTMSPEEIQKMVSNGQPPIDANADPNSATNGEPQALTGASGVLGEQP